MQRIKYDGAPITYYKKGTLCIQGKEEEAKVIRALLEGEDLSVGENEEKEEAKANMEATKQGGIEQMKAK